MKTLPVEMARPVIVFVAAVALIGCGTAARAASTTGLTPAEQARADSGRPPYTAADVRFMQGMIAHHAQALVIAALAPANGAGGAVRTLAGRIDVGQRDEIAFMERWLRERRERVPEHHAGHDTPGHDAGPLMPGMLTAEQLTQLRAARGPEFDRLFLTFMIQHHEGALRMVEELFASPGAGQDVNVFRFASDVTADQTTEVDRMRTMLSSMSSDAKRP